MYTTQLQAGLGLTDETSRLIGLWKPDMSRQDLLAIALSSGAFPSVSARRLRNIVVEAFAPRYLTDAGAPARVICGLQSRASKADMRQLMLLYTCRANDILADFVREIFWSRYAAGSQSLARTDAVDFVRRAVEAGKTGTRWSESTVTRVSNYLMGTCADFGMLGPVHHSTRGILPFRINMATSSILVHDLHFRGLGDSSILHHSDWGIFGLESGEVLQELKRLALRGTLIVQTAASTVHIGWKHNSMEEVLGDLD
jgi:hypothetical protein